MRNAYTALGLGLCLAMVGCGDDDGVPAGDSGVRVDSGGGTGDGGMMDAGGGTGDGGAMDAGGGGGDAGDVDAGDVDSGGGGTDSGVVDLDAAALACATTHPLLDAGARFCGMGDCYCPMSSATNPDSCLGAAVARACCTSAVVCGTDTDAGATCERTHPLLDGGARFCASGFCFCAAPDSCLPAAGADGCCRVPVVCTP